MRVPSRWRKCHTMQFANACLPRKRDRGHFVLIGNTGSGKSTLLIMLMASIFGNIPDELETFNAFVIDPQNDFYRPLLAMDLPLKVILTNVFDRRAWAWDMCADVRDPASAWQLAYAILPEDVASNDNRFYTDAPRHRFAAVLRKLVNRGITWSLRLAYLLAMDELYAAELCRTSKDPEVRRTLVLFDKKQEATKANIETSLLTKLGNLSTYAALMEHCDKVYSLRQMVRSDVLMVDGGDFQFNNVVGPMNYTKLAILKQKIIGQEKSEKRRHYVVIDEFSALNYDKPAKEVLDFFVRSRSRGGRIAVAIHSPEQLVDLYGKHQTNVILSNCQHKIVLKLDDPDGAEYCSKMLGRIHRYEYTSNSNTSFTSSYPHPSSTRGTGVSETFADRALVPPHVLQELPLASLEHGFWGYAIAPGPAGTLRWGFHLSPEFLAGHAVADDHIPSYESCRRPGWQQQLVPLSRAEVEEIGLTYHRDSRKP